MASTWVLSIKLLLISTSLISISMLIKLSIPYVTHLICYKIPMVWYCIISILKPPYLYFVINGIIIVIAVTSRCHKSDEESESHDVSVLPSDDDVSVVYDEEVVKSVVVNNSADVDGVMVSKSMWTAPQRSKSLERLPEKAPVKKTIVGASKSNTQGGRSLRPAAQNENETLENTWKIITESRPVPPTKCDTWQNQDRPLSTAPLAVKKSATFRDRTNYNPTVQSPIKEPSLSQDELNQRVEAFIRKFQDEMRLQRQESINHYMDMIKRGAH